MLLAQNDTLDIFVWPPAAATSVTPDYVTAAESEPTRRILPEDIEQDSIKMWLQGTNLFLVRWTYTEAGARKLLAFQREHAGQNVNLQIGSFEHRVSIAPLDMRPSGWTEEGYLKHRGDKFFGVSKGDAKGIVEGLRKK